MVIPAPFDPAYPDRFAELIGALAQNQTRAAQLLVQAISNPGALDQTKRLPSSLRRWAAVFARDAYTCRYCERRTIAPPILRAVSHVFPKEFKFHPNWKTSETDAAYFLISTSLDHVLPVTRGGSDTFDNLVTACWMCNGMKSNYLLGELHGWQLHEPCDSEWRGLSENLGAIMTNFGLVSDSYLRRWLEAIRNPEPIL